MLPYFKALNPPQLVLRLALHPYASIPNPKREASLHVFDTNGLLVAEYYRPPREMALVVEMLMQLHTVQRVTCNDPQDHLRLFELPHLRQLVQGINNALLNSPLPEDPPTP